MTDDNGTPKVEGTPEAPEEKPAAEQQPKDDAAAEKEAKIAAAKAKAALAVGLLPILCLGDDFATQRGMILRKFIRPTAI